MKTRFYLWPLLALLALSCGKSAIPEMPKIEPASQEERDPWTFYPEKEILVPGQDRTVIAGNLDTKSQLVANGTDKYGVVWTAGDEFRLYGPTIVNEQFAYYYTLYSTTDGGVDAEFSGGSLEHAAEYYAIYPSSASVGGGRLTVSENTYHVFSVVIPDSQIATVGSVAEEANLSFAKTTDLTKKFNFRNIVSIVKFKLAGTAAANVKSVTLKGLSPLAGGYVVYAPDGEPLLLPNITVTGQDKSRTVTLQGTFEANGEYYLALAPCHQDGFSMIFANESGETTTLSSTAGMDFNRSQIYDFGTVTINGFTDTPAGQPEAIQYMTASAPNAKQPVSIAVIPDGFTAGELSDYEIKAKAGIDALFNTEPYKSYRNYFNVWILKVASNESGASVTDGNGTIVTPVDNYFGSRFGATSYGDLDADADKIFDFVSTYCEDVKTATRTSAPHPIEEVPVLIIINDSRYGGIAWNYSNGKTYCLVPTSYDGGSISWAYPKKQANTNAVLSSEQLQNWQNYLVDSPAELYFTQGDKKYSNVGTWKNTLVHEFGGHSIGRLGDEYWYLNSPGYTSYQAVEGQNNWAVPFNLNLAASPTETGWDAVFRENGNLKTSLTAKSSLYAERIGTFQGGDVSLFYRWRSEVVSCMIDNRFYFSTYQRYLLVKRFRLLAGITDELTLDDFLAKDNPEDPVRDQVSSSVIGLSDAVPPRPMPMLPPPRLVEVD